MKEKQLYSRIRNDLLEEFKGFGFKEEVAIPKIGRADIVILSDVGGTQEADEEIIVIEVKLDNKNIMDKLVQTLKYSIFAHRCYLAAKFNKKENFSYEERFLAESLGIGLIEVKDRCKIVNISKKFNPLKVKSTECFEKLGFARCSICNNLVPTNFEATKYEANRVEKEYFVWLHCNWLKQGKLDKRNLSFSDKKEFRRKIRICGICAENLLNL